MSSADGADAGPAERERVVLAARQLAEAEGWVTVTHRRLAERTGVDIEALYRRFPDPAALMSAVAVRGFADLAAALAAARAAAVPAAAAPAAAAGRGDWPAVVAAYLDFAYASPEVYDAMLAHTSDLTLGRDPGPGAPGAAFAELRAALAPLAAGRDPDTLAELAWALLHGTVMLTRGGRLRPDRQEQREDMIMSGLFAGPWTPASDAAGPTPPKSG
ncbi:TetR/AcrR family transcriptional regulator [Micromonospora sp. C31]|uniref:TetR/AcrR family transcriptional regulator n=1 Tax=Micromonospora sp. C31 TaxID=2824876 RepID=UPI001B37BEEA|nr:TetR/AcrR family transcriptional regulator [Micromonospora sp. C31]MBQ1073350.1 TetR/AcrR family transcriptional regulator [Micromonospora sp. C31]